MDHISFTCWKRALRTRISQQGRNEVVSSPKQSRPSVDHKPQNTNIMKKFMLSLLILAGVFTAVLAFHACSADDEAEGPQHSPQAQLLLQKSREFAKKYNVNMALNEDNIEETAKTLSVEQMEKDYREMSEFHLSFDVPNQSTGGRSVNKLRIRKKVTTFEETQVSGSFSCNIDDFEMRGYSVKVDYRLGNGNYSNYVDVTLTHYNSSGSARFMPQGFTQQGNNDCSFSASGTIRIYGNRYSANYFVSVSHSPSGNHASVSRDPYSSYASATPAVVVDHETSSN